MIKDLVEPLPVSSSLLYETREFVNQSDFSLKMLPIFLFKSGSPFKQGLNGIWGLGVETFHAYDF